MIKFYHHFRTAPAGAHVVQLCRTEACQAVGARALEAHVKQRLGVEFGATTADGKFTLEPVYCLGNCACGPSVQVDEQLHARVSPPGLRQSARQARGELMSVRVFVPGDSTACALGADQVAAAP